MWIGKRFRRGFCALILVAATFPLPAAAEYLDCVSFVQRSSDFDLRGNAWQWWSAAKGALGRGDRPAEGAVFVIARTPKLPSGHVALIRQIVDERMVLIDHANWSPIDGRRGHVERAVPMIDVSEANDWSQVRVWYEPTQRIGQRVYPAYGFIYKNRI